MDKNLQQKESCNLNTHFKIQENRLPNSSIINSSIFVTATDENKSKLSAQSLAEARDYGNSHYQLAKLYYDKGDLNKAEHHFEIAKDVGVRPRDNYPLLKTLGFLIRIASEKLDDAKAKKYIELSSELVNELATSLGSLNAEYFYYLGLIDNYNGRFEEGISNLLICMQRSKEENEPEILSKCLLALATMNYYKKNFSEAKNYLDQLEQLLKIINKTYLNGSMYFYAGKIQLELNQFTEALESLSMAIKFLQDKKCWNQYGHILFWKGNIFKKMGEYNKALTYFKLASEILDHDVFQRLSQMIRNEIQDVTDSNVDIYLDRDNRKISEKSIGSIDFKHRFVLLEILFLLARSPGQYFDKEYLAMNIWKDEYNPLIHDKLIYTSVSRLRKLIEPKNHKTSKRKYIIRGKDGYTFNPQAKIRFKSEIKEIQKDCAIANVELSSPV